VSLQMSPAELATRRRAIQQRVERIADSVEQRRQQTRHHQSRRGPSDTTNDATTSSWWEHVANTCVAALRTPPERISREPLIVTEELAYHPLAEDVSLEVIAAIETHPEQFPGLLYRVTTKRVYPENALAAHIIGARVAIDDESLATRKAQFPENDELRYQLGDTVGKSGVELSYDRQLRGLNGLRKLTKNRHGELLHKETMRPPRVGRDAILTLNLPLQRRAEEILDAVVPPMTAASQSLQSTSQSSESTPDVSGPQGGCLAVLDVQSGAVIAAACAPRFDLNLMVDADADAWRQVMNDPRHPFFPRLTHMQLAPGSVFKTLTATAILESGKIDPKHPVHCRGYLDRPDRYRCLIYRRYGVGHGDMDLIDALCRSCNVYFFTAARQLGPEPILEWVDRFGFGRPTGIDLPGERAGQVPRPFHQRKKDGRGDETIALTLFSPFDEAKTLVSNDVASTARTHPWYKGDTLGLAIGQSRLTVTPLQIARMMAAIANGGYLVTPHVVRCVSRAPVPRSDLMPNGGDVHPLFSPYLQPPTERTRLHGLSDATLKQVRTGLAKVVATPHGTGYRSVRLDQISIAGKTGTAETGGSGPDHAWFAGYVPADRPRFAFVAALEHGGSGGKAAGPLARQLVQAMLDLGLLEAERVPPN